MPKERIIFDDRIYTLFDKKIIKYKNNFYYQNGIYVQAARGKGSIGISTVMRSMIKKDKKCVVNKKYVTKIV